MQFDLHIHTTLSPCSSLTLNRLLAQARARGLDGVCITDHDTMAARHLVREGIQPDGLCVIIGMEYATEAGDFLLFGPFEDLPPGLTGREVLERVESIGGAAIAAHPFRTGRSTSEELVSQGLCRIIEGVNGRNSQAENGRTALWRTRYNVGLAGGSDAHSLTELGRATTRFSPGIRTRDDLILALRNNDFSLADQPGSPPLSPGRNRLTVPQVAA